MSIGSWSHFREYKYHHFDRAHLNSHPDLEEHEQELSSSQKARQKNKNRNGLFEMYHLYHLYFVSLVQEGITFGVMTSLSPSFSFKVQ